VTPTNHSNEITLKPIVVKQEEEAKQEDPEVQLKVEEKSVKANEVDTNGGG